MNKHSSPSAGTGSVLLLMTLIVLCLTVFAVLSLSGSVSEYRYSQKIAERSREYYQASNEATQMLREIDRLLHAAYEDDPAIYHAAVEEQLAGFGNLHIDFSGDEPVVDFEIPVDEAQALKVILTLNAPARMTEGFYRITAWQKVPSTEWNTDDSLNLITL